MTLAESSTDAFSPEDFITGEKQVVTQPVVVLSGEGSLPRFQVMGRVTASGKLKISDAGAGDGSENPTHILCDPVDASAADAEVAAYTEGCFNPDLLVKHGSWTDEALKQALESRNIYLRKPG